MGGGGGVGWGGGGDGKWRGSLVVLLKPHIAARSPADQKAGEVSQ